MGQYDDALKSLKALRRLIAIKLFNESSTIMGM